MAGVAVSRAPLAEGCSETATSSLPRLVLVFFFLSGFPALIYQIVWQRALFAIYGVNIESIAVVVTAFMLGLGIGSIAGGYVSQLRVPPLAAFACAEIFTGLYGCFSLRIFHYVALYTAGTSVWKAGCLAFALLAIPTVLMGSTLPLLLTHTIRQLPNVGRATGLLYFVNTLGSACACFVTGMFLMRLYGQSGSVRLAAIVNTAIGISAFLEYLRTRSRTVAATPALPPERDALSTGNSLPFTMGLLLAGAGGFIALAYEIIWCRVFSFATATNPKVFAYVLGSYLAGIAVGSWLVERICIRQSSQSEHLFTVGAAIFGGNLWALFVAPEFANLSADMPFRFAAWIGFSFVAFAAALLGMSFPLICHMTVSPDRNAGRRLSYLYFSNIVGSSLGSFLVGFVLLEYLSLKTLSLTLAAVGMGLGIVVLISAGATLKRIVIFSAVAAVALAVGSLRLTGIYDTMTGRIFAEVLENRHEVVTVDQSGNVYGGGGYDGAFNTDPISNTNFIIRLYAALKLHPAPREALMVGLSSGSWAQVIANDPRVQHLTIIEINPGYLRLIPHHPEVASLLRNPKVNIIIDDGRRWLTHNRAARYDFIVMNAPIHWRANNTNLLSQEFVALVHGRLKPGGVYFFNTTSSAEAQVTACNAFPNVVRIWNFLAVSDAPLHLDKSGFFKFLLSYRIDGKLVIPDPGAPEAQQRLDSISTDIDRLEAGEKTGFLEYGPSLRAKLSGAQPVTDDNMAVEWRQPLDKR